MSKFIWILLISCGAVVILLLLFFIYICFKIEQIDEKEYNYQDDDDIDKT